GIVDSPLVRNQRVKLCSQRIDSKDISIAMVVTRRDHNGNIIINRVIGVSSQFGGNDSSRTCVITVDSEVQIAFVIANFDYGLFCGRPAFKWLPLMEIRNRDG